MTQIQLSLPSNSILAATTLGNYKKGDAEIVLPNENAVAVLQDNNFAGQHLAFGDQRIPLDKKHFSKLKTGLFSSDIKNVRVFYLYAGLVQFHFRGNVTTAKGKAGNYDFMMTMKCNGFDEANFLAFVKKLTFATDKGTLLLDVASIQETMSTCVSGAMRSVLDDEPKGYMMPLTANTPGPLGDAARREWSTMGIVYRKKTGPILCSFLADKIKNLGLLCNFKIL